MYTVGTSKSDNKCIGEKNGQAGTSKLLFRNQFFYRDNSTKFFSILHKNSNFNVILEFSNNKLKDSATIYFLL